MRADAQERNSLLGHLARNHLHPQGVAMPSKSPWFNPRLGRQNAKRRRLVAKGTAPAGDKASLRAAADAAIAERPARIMKPGKPLAPPTRGSLYQRAKDLLS